MARTLPILSKIQLVIRSSYARREIQQWPLQPAASAFYTPTTVCEASHFATFSTTPPSLQRIVSFVLCGDCQRAPEFSHCPPWVLCVRLPCLPRHAQSDRKRAWELHGQCECPRGKSLRVKVTVPRAQGLESAREQPLQRYKALALAPVLAPVLVRGLAMVWSTALMEPE